MMRKFTIIRLSENYIHSLTEFHPFPTLLQIIWGCRRLQGFTSKKNKRTKISKYRFFSFLQK